jgi:hypothetical protein
MEKRSVVATRDFWAIFVASALFAVVILWSTPGFPATRPVDILSPAAGDLEQLAHLDTALHQALRTQRDRLGSGCEFAAVRAELIAVQREAIEAVQRLGALWRDGRFRNGGFALSEVLVYDFAAVIDEARRDTAVADTFATLEAASRDGSRDARAVLERMIASDPAAPACLARALDEDTVRVGARILEQVILEEYVRPRVW